MMHTPLDVPHPLHQPPHNLLHPLRHRPGILRGERPGPGPPRVVLQPDDPAARRPARVLHRVAQVVEALGEVAADDDGDGAVGEVPGAEGGAGGGRGLAGEDGGDLGDAGLSGVDV